jgi:hypothetical protein
MKELSTAYKAAGYFRHGPPSKEAASAQREARRAALASSGLPAWAESVEGAERCCYCAAEGHGAPKCRVKGVGCSNHGPVAEWRGRWVGGPDACSGHFPIGCHVVCSQPSFSGTVTVYDRESGQHTLTLDGGGLRLEFLAYRFSRCTVTTTADTRQLCSCGKPSPTAAAGAPAVVAQAAKPAGMHILFLRSALLTLARPVAVQRTRAKRADDGRGPAGTVSVAEGVLSHSASTCLHASLSRLNRRAHTRAETRSCDAPAGYDAVIWAAAHQEGSKNQAAS